MKKVKKNASQSQASLRSVRSTKSEVQANIEIALPNLDLMTVKFLGLQSDDQRLFLIKVAFFDQIILSEVIRPCGLRRGHNKDIDSKSGPSGTMSYDPSDYEKMCLFANNPMIVQIQPLKEEESDHASTVTSYTSTSKPFYKAKHGDISCCYIDILPIFIDVDKLCVRKRLQPLYEQTVLNRKSWNNLPFLTLEISVNRHPQNHKNHQLLKEANHFKLTVVGAYNLMWPNDGQLIYTAATKTPLYNSEKLGVVMFNPGTKTPKHFKSTSFFPRWESQRSSDDVFASDDQKSVFNLEDIYSEEKIDLDFSINKDHEHSVIWASYHRTLLLGDMTWFSKHIRQYKWPLEIHIYDETGAMNMMAAIDLFRLLSPGVDTLRLAVPLKWGNASWMMEQCGSEPLLSAPNSPSLPNSRYTKGDSGELSPRLTGSNNTDAFVVVEVKLARPLRYPCIAPMIADHEINEMLSQMEEQLTKRVCSARGQLDRDWQGTVRMAVNSLKKVPYFGMTDLCTFNRQLSESRTRVEIFTSLWQDAAVYVNNKFVVSDFLGSEDIYEEMLMMAHACLIKSMLKTLVNQDRDVTNPVLRAARHARHMQDIPHAVDLYSQVVVENKKDADYWREFSTCLKDVDKDWALVCLHQSVLLNPRHPLTLISMACTALEEDPASAEPFFVALLALYPLWTTGWIIASAYYIHQEMFHMADNIIDKLLKIKAEGLAEEISFPRMWDYELGDWWDSTPLLPGTTRYYNAADLLLRLRAMPLAEVCLARALTETGVSAEYYHLVALTCRLRGDIEEALCHINVAIQKFGELSYLRSLEAECFHKQRHCTDAKASYGKAVHCSGPYSLLMSLPCREEQRMRPILVDLVRRQPSAYAWMALAENWLKCNVANDMLVKSEEETPPAKCAAACAIQALKIDRRAGKAWALLSTLVKPLARRRHCRNMAQLCGHRLSEEHREPSRGSKESLCWGLGGALRECLCGLCRSLPSVV